MRAGYEIFRPSWPLTRLRGCANKDWTEDLLLVSRDFLLGLGEVEVEGEYEIQVIPEDEEVMIYDTQSVTL